VKDLIGGRDQFFHRQNLDQLVEDFEMKLRRSCRLGSSATVVLSTLGGKLLLRGRSLEECGVKDGSTIQLQLAVLGAGKRPLETNCSRCTVEGPLLSDGLCRACAEDDYVHQRRSQA